MNGQARETLSQDELDEMTAGQIDAVRERYEGTSQWMKAPNGKKTNLSEKQWLQVRTPAFKEWFGDWEAAATAREIQAMPVEPVTVSSVPLTKKEAEAKARAFGEMENKRYGVRATLTTGTIGKIVGHQGFNVAQIFDALPGLFGNSVLALSETSDGHKQRNNVKAYHHFVNKFKADGKEYYIRFTAYEMNEKKPTGKRSIHSTAISEVEVYAANSKASTLGRSGSIDPGVKGQTSFIDKKIAQVLDSVNNASRVVDENGEPLVVYHGTNSEFSVFDINASGKNTRNKGIFGNGFYMTNLEELAQYYRGEKRPNYQSGKGKVMGLFANIKNPFYWNSREGYKTAGKLGFPKNRMRDGKLLPLNNDSDIIKFTDRLKSNGFDGVIYSEEKSDGEPYAYSEIVAFSPEQIKSATDNRGTFDASNPDIYYQTAASDMETWERQLYECESTAEAIEFLNSLKLTSKQLKDFARHLSVYAEGKKENIIRSVAQFTVGAREQQGVLKNTINSSPGVLEGIALKNQNAAQDIEASGESSETGGSQALSESREAAPEMAENIRRGTEAMEKVIAERTDVMNAMHRDDVGDISFFWGEPGRGEKLKHGWGISHLLAHRDKQHQDNPQVYPDGMTVLHKIPEVIAKGESTGGSGENIPNAQRVNISYDGYTAILSLYKEGNRQTWLLTGWKDEKTSDASGEVYGPTGATLDGPMRFRPEEGAEVSSARSLPPETETVKGQASFGQGNSIYFLWMVAITAFV